jgi:succinate dehydrogenase / fumarate reductase, cytochrome b subunit
VRENARGERGAHVAKRKSDVGTLYRGSPGQWSWIAHRITGVAIVLFLFVHIADTAVVGWGPEAYDRVESIYHNWFVRLLELGLVAAVLYHALNGLKIMLFDFWPKTTRHMKALSLLSTGIFLLAMIPITWIMGKATLQLLGWI